MAYANEEGWQLVRYGRRGRSRQRTFQSRPQRPNWPSWDRGGMDVGRKDGAFPGPRLRVRTPTSFPNQPEPPSGISSYPRRRSPLPSRYGKPQVRTYAQVVRQANPGRGGNWSFGRGPPWFRQQGRYFQSRTDQQSAPTDPKFGKLVRQLKKVIKVVHHLQNVTGDTGRPQPQMISRMVDTLANMIKPAAPTEKTMDMIMGNAHNWGHTTLIILRDHYKEALDGVLEDLMKEPELEWKAAFEVAIRWARRNLPRLPRDVVDHAEALVAAAMGPNPGPGRSRAQNVQEQNPQEGNRDVVGERRTRGDGLRQRQEDRSQVEFLEEIVVAPPSQMDEQGTGQQGTGQQLREEQQEGMPQERQRVQDMRREERDLEELDDGDDDAFELAPLHLPREQRDPRMGLRQGPQDEEEQQPVGSELLEGEDSPIQEPKTISVTAQVLADASRVDSVQDDWLRDIAFELEEEDSVKSTPVVRTRLYGPTKHIHTDRKMVEWNITVTKKWLFIGDSNLARLPHHDIEDLQIDSYPGANFRHMASIFSDAITPVTVEKVLISCGLNCRGQKIKETAVKQLQTAIRMAKRRFPYAEIWVPIINYSTNLPNSEQRDMIQLNTHIFKNLPHVIQLTEDMFHTERDNVHWTKETAQAMLDHWVSELNLKAP